MGMKVNCILFSLFCRIEISAQYVTIVPVFITLVLHKVEHYVLHSTVFSHTNSVFLFSFIHTLKKKKFQSNYVFFSVIPLILLLLKLHGDRVRREMA